MKLTKNNPILTAYALGELSRRKMAKVERILKEHPELQEEVRQVQEMATRLSQELDAAADGLTEEQRENVIEESIKNNPNKATSKFSIGRTSMKWRVAFLTLMVVIIGSASLHILELIMLSNARKEVIVAQQDNAQMMKRFQEFFNGGTTTTSTTSNEISQYNQTKGYDFQGKHYDHARYIPPSEKNGDTNSTTDKFGSIELFNIHTDFLKFNPAADTAPLPPSTAYGHKLPTNFSDDSMENYGNLTTTTNITNESYGSFTENPFLRVLETPLSTFGIDVDTASYSNVRRFLTEGNFPPPDAVRIEELINYFKYNYPNPQGDGLFSIAVDVHSCPWEPKHWLARIGLHGKEIGTENRPPVNLVFLLDTSGSMDEPNKLPLLIQAMKLMTESLTARDRLTIVTYSDQAAMKLPPTTGDQKATIMNVLNSLHADGSTNGEGGIRLAYNSALDTFIQGGINRVLLATDGDFNRGIVDTNSLVALIKEGRDANIFLNVLGFGEGNLQDDRLEALADKGNGQYAYIDSFAEARRVLLDQVNGALVTIAKDVKIQVEFNPKRVDAYRLIGYENRQLAAQDFNDDRKDAGEIGAGHTVTALYELAPVGAEYAPPAVDGLKYQQNPSAAPPSSEEAPTAFSNELMTVKLRYKHPQGDVSDKVELAVTDEAISSAPDSDYTFAAAVAAFGMKLRQSRYGGYVAMDTLLQWAQEGKGADPDGRRAEFIDLVRTASVLMGGQKN